MRSFDRSLHLSEALLWRQFRALGIRMFFSPVGYGVFFLLVTLITARSPNLLTGPTEHAIRLYTRRYFGGVDDASAGVLALVLVQGPYMLSIFGAVTGLRVGRKFTQREIESGRFELLLAAPYDPDEVFRGLITGSMVLTLAQLFVLAVVSLGGAIVLLLSLGVSFRAGFDHLVYVAFLTPIPATLWAVVVTVITSLFSATGRVVNAVENVTNIVAIAPALGTLLVLSFYPNVDLSTVALLTLGLSVAGTILGSIAVDTWFSVETVLSQ